MGVIKGFDLLEEPGILRHNEVDGSSLSSPSSGSTDSMDVLLLGLRKVVVDNQMDLLDINTSGQ